ncbi:hypothetical protein Hgul01_05256 [Herpetosiphon gulosus]|uniref:NB-ARC domain-containing protein n=1 Tax=Herpetosiphon gulosus TaxID=1973496 RepID=A0ABP9XAD5_9CHLR
MRVQWDVDAVQKLLLSPHKLIGTEPWGSWIRDQGGLECIYARMRTLPLKDLHAQVLEVLLNQPGASVTLYQTQLGLERSAYHSRKKQLLLHLSQFLNTWESKTPTSRSEKPSLPIPMTSLIGRTNEVASVIRLLHEPSIRLLTLVGTGGVGKTRLALQVASELQHEFPDGVHFVALGGLFDATLFPSLLAQHFAIKEATTSIVEALKGYLRTKHLLIVLDNFEQLSDAALLLGEILDAAPALKFLVTSRRRLNLYGEQQYPVPMLPIPDAQIDLRPETLQAYDAIRLFCARAQAVDPHWRLDVANSAAVVAICTRLDGLPLALELAAARIALFPVETIRARLDARFELLTDGAINSPFRQRTLKALLDWSFELLNQQEQAVFMALGVFTNSGSVAAAEAVCATVIESGTSLPTILETLALNNLLMLEVRDDQLRFRMLETIATYAQEQIQNTHIYPELQNRHSRFYLDLAESIEPELTGTQQASWFNRLAMEYLNIRLALTWFIQDNQREAAERVCGALGRFWWVRGFLSEGRTLIKRVWQIPAEIAPHVAAKTLSSAGLLTYGQSNYAEAQLYYEECLRIRRNLGDIQGCSMMLNNLGIIAQMRCDYATARAYFEESLQIDRRSDNPKSIATVLSNLGNIAFEQGDAVNCLAYCEESLTIKRTLNDTWGTGNALINYATMLFYFVPETGSRIKALYDEGFEIMRQLQDAWGMARVFYHYGIMACAEGNSMPAYGYFKQSAELQLSLNDIRGLLNTLDGFWYLFLVLGRLDVAIRTQATVERFRAAYGIPNSPQLVVHHQAIFTQYLPEGLPEYPLSESEEWETLDLFADAVLAEAVRYVGA